MSLDLYKERNENDNEEQAIEIFASFEMTTVYLDVFFIQFLKTFFLSFLKSFKPQLILLQPPTIKDETCYTKIQIYFQKNLFSNVYG